MDKQKRNTWILVGVVVMLGLAAVAEQVRERKLAPKPLLGASLQGVNTIALECTGCPTRRFERVQGAWRMTEPYDAPADPAAIARILELPEAPVAIRHPVEHFELDKIGLAPPPLVAVLGPYRFEFGGLDALNSLRYVRIGSTVALLADKYSGTLMATPEALLDRLPRRLRSTAAEAEPHPVVAPLAFVARDQYRQHGADEGETRGSEADRVVEEGRRREPGQQDQRGARDQRRHHRVHLRIHVEERQEDEDPVLVRERQGAYGRAAGGDVGVVAVDDALGQAGRARRVDDRAGRTGRRRNRRRRLERGETADEGSVAVDQQARQGGLGLVELRRPARLPIAVDDEQARIALGDRIAQAVANQLKG